MKWWEPFITSIQLVLIGPELKYERRSLFLSVETVPRGMTIAYQTHSKMKKVDSTMPDLVFLQNFGFTEYTGWLVPLNGRRSGLYVVISSTRTPSYIKGEAEADLASFWPTVIRRWSC